jgi:hypothetical protein
MFNSYFSYWSFTIVTPIRTSNTGSTVAGFTVAIVTIVPSAFNAILRIAATFRSSDCHPTTTTTTTTVAASATTIVTATKVVAAT